MWGIIPAAGRGSRIQPLAFSKELLPVGSRRDGESERPMAVSEHLIERMLMAGVDKLCFVISPGKSDILEYFGGRVGGAEICYVVQDRAAGLCDALFRALPFIHEDEAVCVGLPDTVWFPKSGLSALEGEDLSFLLFPVEKPQLFDAVVFDESHAVRRIEVKAAAPTSHWVWGAFKLSGRVLRELHTLWRTPGRGDEYFGTLVNAYLEQGGSARAVPVGRAYVDVGTFNGYREATRLLDSAEHRAEARLIRGDAGTSRVGLGAPEVLSRLGNP
jgi:glucose-1-phosphate thymidylyltransferase